MTRFDPNSFCSEPILTHQLNPPDPLRYAYTYTHKYIKKFKFGVGDKTHMHKSTYTYL
ncbi:hypothetical protein HanXRQr2_Chr13g0584851 [Helianthus annuus]|uniref:Uncharacterized protein n=1 Tax=Helianthus annuus TaxID=4232 RepID=A0A9K3HBD5_HELAN|nr:hypothetical protein HanXRQr2_Chr13g0584851 [Helianthus annuus]